MRSQGNTASGKTTRGEFHVYHGSNGKVCGKARKRLFDVGTWTIGDDRAYCRRGNRWRSAGRDCSRVYLIGMNRIRRKAINYPYDTTANIRFGDPEILGQRIRGAELQRRGASAGREPANESRR